MPNHFIHNTIEKKNVTLPAENPKGTSACMRLFIRTFIVLLCLLTSAYSLQAQDAAFSQFYANPLYLNPALTGTTECGRLHLNYRNQWPALDKAYVTYSVGYDQQLPEIRSGFGFLVMSDQQGDGAYNRTLAGGFYSYQLQIGLETFLQFGVKAAFYQEGINWSKLIFADMIDPTTGTIGIGNEIPPVSNVYAADFATGLALSYSDKFFAGFAADHLSQPNLSFYGDENVFLPRKFTFHAGYNFNASNGMSGAGKQGDLLVQPNLLFMQQGEFNQLNAGVYLNKHPFVLGVWLRHSFQNPDAIVVLAGIQQEKFRIGYSYDYSVSKLSGKSGGAHEISLAWEFCVYTRPKRRIGAINSPRF